MDDGDDGADNPTNLLNKSAQFNKMAVDFYFEKVILCSLVEDSKLLFFAILPFYI